MKTLVIAAHPDDEVLGCGGTIGRLAQQGQEVHIAILGEGITSRYQERQNADAELIKSLKRCASQVARELGATELYLFEFPDNRFDSVPLLEIVHTIEELVRRVQPTTIYTHHNGDLNIDHSVTHRAVLTATRPIQGQPVKEIYAFEVPSSTEWAFQQLEQPFRPNTFVDITATLELKIKGMALYESEARAFPHPRSTEALRAIAQRWGSVVGCQATEAFQLIRAIR
ncbi:PIG-L family deacetylase [Anaerolineae bacterium CFX7]|nr:PIG-L family deacetylase [Anaerolineae bacterium CFX7]